MTKQIELEPCPFCGSAYAPTYTESSNFGSQQIICLLLRGGCGASTALWPEGGDELAAADLWNRRAAIAAQKGANQ